MQEKHMRLQICSGFRQKVLPMMQAKGLTVTQKIPEKFQWKTYRLGVLTDLYMTLDCINYTVQKMKLVNSCFIFFLINIRM